MFNIYNGYKIAVVKDIRKDKFRPHITTCCNTWGIKANTVCSTDQVLKTLRQFKNPTKHTLTHSDTTHHCTEHFALRHKLKLCTDPFLYRSDLVTFRRMLYLPDVCNCTMPYVHLTVPAYAVRYPAKIAEVVALTLVRQPWPLAALILWSLPRQCYGGIFRRVSRYCLRCLFEQRQAKELPKCFIPSNIRPWPTHKQTKHFRLFPTCTNLSVLKTTVAC